MKKILITGAGSYIGTSFEKYMFENYPDEFHVDTIDMTDGLWRERSFSGYDSVFHVAGIAHQKETKENSGLYYKVNRDLAVETAKKSKQEGVQQFVFLSSMSVYGIDEGIITRDTPLNPKSHYGKSKYEAELIINGLSSKDFRVCIVRPPMVYGKGCKGNYNALVKIAKILPVLPDYKNQRSMISINELSNFIIALIRENADGIYFPQDTAYVCTCEMIMCIRKEMGKKFIVTKVANPFIDLLRKNTTKGRKAFGNLVYQDFDTVSKSK